MVNQTPKYSLGTDAWTEGSVDHSHKKEERHNDTGLKEVIYSIRLETKKWNGMYF